MAASADIFFEHDPWRRPLAWSAVLHGVLFAAILLYSVFQFPGENWGAGTGTGDAMSVTMVATIPLPASPIKTQNVLANESKGLSQSLPKPKEVEQPDAIPIPEREAKRKARERAPAIDRIKPIQPIPEASNVVPYGEGGPVTNLYGFTAGGAKGGFNFTGGGGDFGSRYGWYVNAMRNKISENWLKYEVDPRISTAARCYVTFDITRSGQPINVRIEQSSGVPSLDQSALHTLQRIDSFGPLPSDYPGNKVSVEFWFDYHR